MSPLSCSRGATALIKAHWQGPQVAGLATKEVLVPDKTRTIADETLPEQECVYFGMLALLEKRIPAVFEQLLPCDGMF